MSGKTDGNIPYQERQLEDMVLITKADYDRMVEQIDWLTCLEAAGVDNWSGYDYAIELKHEGLVID